MTDTCCRKKNTDLKKEIRKLQEQHTVVVAKNKALLDEMDKKENLDAALRFESSVEAEAQLKQRDEEKARLKSSILELQGKLDSCES